MTVTRRVWRDIRSGENLDTYATIVIGITLSVLNVIGVTSTQVLFSSLIGVLSLQSINILVTRAKMDQLSAGSRSPVPIFSNLHSYPEPFESDMQATGDIFLGGVSLGAIFPYYLHVIEARLRAGATVRVILIEPGSPGAALAEERLMIPADADRRNSHIRTTIGYLTHLRGIGSGNLELRLTKDELPMGWIYHLPDKAKARLFIEHFAYKARNGKSMKLVLTPAMGEIYEYYRTQTEEIWAAATPHP